MIKIDFHAGTHGHFLEYVVNTYLFGVPAGEEVFNQFGASHATDSVYQQNRQAVCGHFSRNAGGRSDRYNTVAIDHDDLIIQIFIDQSDDKWFFAGLTNVLHRTDKPFARHLSLIQHESRQQLRNNYYSKINERATYCNIFPPLAIKPNFIFPFCCFYNFSDFITQLGKLANSLSQEFVADKNLYSLWLEFISKNQGWQSLEKCRIIIENIFNEQDTPIQCTALEEAWINYTLSKSCQIYDGFLFEEQYPLSTLDIYRGIFNG